MLHGPHGSILRKFWEQLDHIQSGMRNSRALPFTVTYRCYTVQRRVCFLHNDSSQLPQKYFAHL